MNDKLEMPKATETNQIDLQGTNKHSRQRVSGAAMRRLEWRRRFEGIVHGKRPETPVKRGKQSRTHYPLGLSDD